MDALPTLAAPHRSVQVTFEEAHRCYLYGFRIACAALCRATVDFSLREVLRIAGYRGPLGEFSDVLQLSEAEMLLGDLHGLADQIRKAGNDAVHDASKFEADYPPDKVQELLIATRKIIEHLYTNSKT